MANGDYGTLCEHLAEDSSAAHDAVSLSSDWRFPDPRYVSFRKDGSVGLRLTGGNDAGIFVAASQLGSPAALAGLVPGDKILKVSGMEVFLPTFRWSCISLENSVRFHRNCRHDVCGCR